MVEQIQKMGILKPSRSTDKLGASSAKRRSIQADIANLKPLKPGGALGFSAFRDTDARSEVKASRKVSVTSNAMDSDDDEEIDTEPKIPETDTEEFKSNMLSPEDAKQQGELAEGVKKIKVSLLPFHWLHVSFTAANESITAETSTFLRTSHRILPCSWGSQVSSGQVPYYVHFQYSQSRQP